MAQHRNHSLDTASSHREISNSVGLKSARQVKLLTGGMVFIFLTAGTFWYQFSRIQPSDAVPQWDNLQWTYLLLMLICLPIDAFVCGLRMWVVCRVFRSGVSFWTCLKAECANLGISMLTPSQSGGGFGQIYMLNRGGVKIGTALTISLITFLGSMVALL
ncbi:MAG: lysylphosphatidylglycerol synthase domain-containing protein, partial [Desulfobacterales bacterium]